MPLFWVKVYYRVCPDCGQTWSAQLSQENVIRIGKEKFECKCGKEWPTGRMEWAHLSPKQRRDYFVSTAEIGVLLLCTVVPAIFGYFIGTDAWRTAAIAGAVGFLVGVVFVVVLWAIKLAIVAVSLRRCPRSDELVPPFSPPVR